MPQSPFIIAISFLWPTTTRISVSCLSLGLSLSFRSICRPDGPPSRIRTHSLSCPPAKIVGQTMKDNIAKEALTKWRCNFGFNLCHDLLHIAARSPIPEHKDAGRMRPKPYVTFVRSYDSLCIVQKCVGRWRVSVGVGKRCCPGKTEYSKNLEKHHF